MPTGQVNLRVDVPADVDRCWKTLTHVPTIAEWFSIVEDAREIEPLRLYSAVLMDRIGPFHLRADLQIRFDEVDEKRRIRGVAEGEDRQVASRIFVDATLTLTPRPQGTRVEIEGRYEVTGRIATTGSPMIRKKASTILREFEDHVVRALG